MQHSQAVIHPINHILIVGDGLIGLCTAHKFLQTTAKHITILTNEALRDHRPHEILDQETLKFVQNTFGLLLNQATELSFTDAEQQIRHSLLSQKGNPVVEMIDATLCDILNIKRVLVEQNDSSLRMVNADLILDATESYSSVLKIFNQKKPDHFVKDPIGVASQDMLLKTFIKIPEKNIPDLCSELESAQHFEQHITKLQKLGWSHFYAPTFHCTSHASGLYCVHLQAPENIKPENFKRWIETFITSQLNTDTIDITYVVAPELISGASTVLKHPSFKGDAALPAVVPLGNALASPDPRLGSSMLAELMKISWLMDFLKAENGGLIFMQAGYEQKLVNKHQAYVESSYQVYYQRMCVALAQIYQYQSVAMFTEQNFKSFVDKAFYATLQCAQYFFLMNDFTLDQLIACYKIFSSAHQAARQYCQLDSETEMRIKSFYHSFSEGFVTIAKRLPDDKKAQYSLLLDAYNVLKEHIIEDKMGFAEVCRLLFESAKKENKFFLKQKYGHEYLSALTPTHPNRISIATELFEIYVDKGLTMNSSMFSTCLIQYNQAKVLLVIMNNKMSEALEIKFHALKVKLQIIPPALPHPKHHSSHPH